MNKIWGEKKCIINLIHFSFIFAIFFKAACSFYFYFFDLLSFKESMKIRRTEKKGGTNNIKMKKYVEKHIPRNNKNADINK